MNQSQRMIADLGEAQAVSQDDKSLIWDVVQSLVDDGGRVTKKGATKSTVELDGKQIGVATKSVRASGDWVISVSAKGDWSVSNRRDVQMVKYDPDKDSVEDGVERSLKALRGMK